MNTLKEEGLLLDDTTKDLVENTLVLIKANGVEVNNFDELKNDKVKHIAIGEPESVPAGKYADEVLKNTGIKDNISDKLVFAKDVKEVLAWVASGNADVGFVYLSDALNNSNVKIVENIDEVNNHSKIVYPVSVIKDSKNIEDLSTNLNMDINDLMVNLTSMELKGLIKQAGGNYFISG